MIFREQDEFNVLAQRRRGDPVTLIGSVWAPTPKLAAFYAATTYDEEHWTLVYVVNRRHIIPVIVDHEIGEEVPR